MCVIHVYVFVLRMCVWVMCVLKYAPRCARLLYRTLILIPPGIPTPRADSRWRAAAERRPDCLCRAQRQRADHSLCPHRHLRPPDLRRKLRGRRGWSPICLCRGLLRFSHLRMFVCVCLLCVFRMCALCVLIVCVCLSGAGACVCMSVRASTNFHTLPPVRPCPSVSSAADACALGHVCARGLSQPPFFIRL